MAVIVVVVLCGDVITRGVPRIACGTDCLEAQREAQAPPALTASRKGVVAGAVGRSWLIHSIDAIIFSRALTLVAFSVNSVERYELLLGATLSNPNQQDKVNHYII